MGLKHANDWVELAKRAETFIDREIIAIDEVAADFAARVVTSILEGF